LVVLGALWRAASAGAFTENQLLTGRLDPTLDYRTLTTAHFRLHYPKELSEVAGRIGETAEASYRKVSRTLGVDFVDPTNIVIVEQSDESNVFTTVFPDRQIFLDLVLPAEGQGLNDFADYPDWVLTHEYTHVLHLQMKQGIYRALGSLFGSWVNPNLGTPAWLKEGLAVYLESTLTPKGRGESATYRMIMRKAVEENKLRREEFATLSSASNYEDTRWPWTIRPYLFGYYLVRTLIRNSAVGADKIFWRTAGGLPFDSNALLASSPFKSMDDLWEKMLEEVEAESRTEIRALGKEPETKLEYLSHTGEIHSGLVLSPDGQTLLATRDSALVENLIEKWDLKGDSFKGPFPVVARSTGTRTTFSRSGRFLLFDQTARARRYYLMSDLYIYDRKKREIVSVSPYFRARDPEASPDGVHVVFVANERGSNVLVRSNTAWENLEILYEPPPFTRITGPRYSPDGTTIAFELHDPKTGAQDLALLKDGKIERVIADGSENMHVSWSPDGKYLLFSSDRNGIPNIYAYAIASRKTYRISHVVGGLFYPVLDPAKKWLYVVSYRSTGYDVARFPWQPSTWTAVPSRVRADATTILDAEAVPEPSETHAPSGVSVVDHPYSAWGSLLPQYLRPSFAFYPYTTQYGAEFGAVDPLFFHSYTFDLRYDTASRMPVGKIFYFDAGFSSPWSLTLENQATASRGAVAGLSTVNFTLHYPLTEDGNHVYLNAGIVAATPNEGTFGSAYSPAMGPHLGYHYDTQYKDFGASLYQTGSLVDLSLRHLFPLVSRDRATTILSGTLERHFGGFSRRDAFHLGVQGAEILSGRPSTYAFFGVTGYESFPLSNGGGYLLYGYPPDRVVTSTGLGIANFAYTFPIVEAHRNLFFLPIYLGQTSMGVRAQTAAVELPANGTFTPWSYGAEVYQELIAGQVFDLTAKLGAYNGPRELGGEFQTIFSLQSSDF
jgi:WD40 repeat protein